MNTDPWICEICAEEFVNEIDMLAHQFNSSCEREIKKRWAEEDRRERRQGLSVLPKNKA